VRGADARQIVAHQVDDHQILGAILGALSQRLPERRIMLRSEAARTSALDRPRLDVAARIDSEESLR
jgi:hypothetical protein